jgi:hypothetical protein
MYQRNRLHYPTVSLGEYSGSLFVMEFPLWLTIARRGGGAPEAGVSYEVGFVMFPCTFYDDK